MYIYYFLYNSSLFKHMQLIRLKKYIFLFLILMDNNSICLNMIVKNESHVIKETLENLCKYITFSYYVISDTGSTDNTIQIITNFFNSRNIKGEIHNDEWKDFGYNRSLALKYAYKKTKYLFIFDADDKIFGDFKLPKIMDKDSYFLKFGNGVTYKRILLVSNQHEWNFIGVLHEYINCISKKNTSCDLIDGNYFVDSGKSGSRSNDPEKYSKDAIILEKAFYEAEKNNEHIKIRYAFYCAQSYRDSNQKEKAIEWYKKRAELKDWDQEVYFSYYMIGKLYSELNEIEKAIYYWTIAYEVDANRYESIYEIISHFRKTGHPTIAYQYYLMIKNFNTDLNNKLFVYYPIYEYLLDYELSIILLYNNKHSDALKVYKKLFLIQNIQFELKISILENFMFYINNIHTDLKLNEDYLNFVQKIYLQTNMFLPHHVNIINKVTDKFTSCYKDYDIELIKDRLSNKKDKVTVFLSMTSCKRYDLFVKTVNSFLLCCKDIQLVDYFFCVDDNSSNEDRKNMITNYKFFKYHLNKENEKGHLNSMNIIWDKLNELKPKYWIHLEDDWQFIKPCNYVQKSINFLEKYRKDNIHQILFNKNYGETIDCYNLTGGERIDEDFLLHIKDQPNLTGRNCSYWPHYSFRPSMINTDIILNIGNFDSPNTFFEMDYANKYCNLGFKSAFYNEITSIHIGKLTSEKNSTDKKNAYQLNGVRQFSENKTIDYKYAIIDSVDEPKNTNININRINDEKFVLNQYVKKLFLNNNFNSSKNIIYNYLTHINIWKKLVNDNVQYYLIADFNLIVDDKLNNFIKKILNSAEIDILILKNKINLVVSNNKLNTDCKSIFNENNPINLNKITSENIGSTSYIYIINKNSAQKLLNFINNNGIINKNLKELFLRNTDIVTLETDEYIFNTNINFDDIDESEIIDFNKLENNSDYFFIKTKDHYGDDIEYNKDLNIEEMFFNADITEECIGFNTLGFFKNKIDIDNLIELKTGNENDGIYININKYNKKYNKNIYNENKFILLRNKTINSNEIIPSFVNIDSSKKDSISELLEFANSNDNCIAVSDNGSFKNNIHIGLCLNHDSINTYIHYDKYIKHHFTNYNIENEHVKFIENYIVFEIYDYMGNDIDYKSDLSISELMKIADTIDNCDAFNSVGFFKINVNINNLARNDYIIHNRVKLFVKIDKLHGSNKYLKLKNINTLEIDYKYSEEFNEEEIMKFIDSNDYIAYNSYGYLIKYDDDIFNNFININEIHNNYIAIDVVKLYNKQNKSKSGIRIKLINNLSIEDFNKFTMGSLKWNNYEFVFSDSFVDYYVILGDHNKNSYYDPEKTIIFNSEQLTSEDFMLAIDCNIAFWKNNKNYIELKYNNYFKKYNKIISDMPIDNNLIEYINNKKNNFVDNIDDISKSIFDYKYSIINDKNNIWDALLAETFCFYTGDDDISGYINNDVFIKIIINNEEESYNTIKNLIDEGIWDKNIEFIKKEKFRILDYYNLFPTIERIIENK